MDSSGSGQEQAAGCCEYGNEPSGSTKGGEFLVQLRDSQEERCFIDLLSDSN
jgi:hypothetical protein